MPPAFCAGADLTPPGKTFASPTDAGFSASPVNPAAFEIRKPVIAAVNGHAIGIGLTLAMQADIRIVADDAKYAIPQVRRGVVPDMMSHWTVERVAPMSAALSKRLLWDSARHGFTPREVAEHETELHHRVTGTADAAEGVRAFLDRRDPDWTSRVSADWKELPWK